MIFFSYVAEMGFNTSVWDDCVNPDKKEEEYSIIPNLYDFILKKEMLKNVQIILFRNHT